MQAHKTEVVIVGAGLAGLSAAHLLKKQGKTVCVIEARDRVGGRTFTQSLAGGHRVDLGGQWLGPTQTEMYDLCKKFSLEVFPTYNEGQNLFYDQGKLKKYSSDADALPKLPLWVLLNLLYSSKKIRSLCHSLDVEQPWAHPEAWNLDGQTFESWIKSQTKSKVAANYYRLITEAIFSAEARDISALHALFYFKSGGSMEQLASTPQGAQQHVVIGGTQQISERLAQEIGLEYIHLNSPVKTVEQDKQGIRLLIQNEQGKTQYIEAQYAIITLPPTLAGRLSYQPPLPAQRDQLTQKIPMGSVIKVMAVYKSPFWRENHLTGQVASSEGPIKVIFDNSPKDGSLGVLLGFLEANDGRQATILSHEERKKLVIKCFKRFFGPQAEEPLQYLEKDWMSDEFSRGCYGGHFPPGVWTSYGPALREPVGRIHWAGTETATIWNGYMEGAVRSGKRAAEEVLQVLNSINSL